MNAHTLLDAVSKWPKVALRGLIAALCRRHLESFTVLNDDGTPKMGVMLMKIDGRVEGEDVVVLMARGPLAKPLSESYQALHDKLRAGDCPGISKPVVVVEPGSQLKRPDGIIGDC